MFRVAFDRHNVNRLRLVRVHLDGKTKITRQVAADFSPLLAGIIAAQHVPMLLHEEHLGTRRMHRDAMDAMTDLRIRVGQFVLRLQAAIDRPPCLAAIISAKDARGRDGDVNAVRVFRVEKDRMDRHPARARLPEIAFRAAQTGKFLPRFSAVHRFEERRVLDAGIDRVGIGQRRCEMPDTLEFPRMLRTVIPLVGADFAFIHELVALAFGEIAGSR